MDVVLQEADWLGRQQRHRERVDALLAGHLDRARRGERHPVEDFLFTYYSLRPGQLRRWHPGAGTVLAGPAAHEREGWPYYVNTRAGLSVDVEAFLARRADAVRHVRDLLAATASREAQVGCFGLHEWAMVYRTPPEQVRHNTLALRLGPARTDAVVEQHRIRCTHFDAFRFFTPDARPLNAVQPRREDQVALEQPGCLHATMDVYKWAYQLAPAVPSEVVVDCFELARDVRVLDMRASPYDVGPLGYAPVPIETPEGKATFAVLQRGFARRAAPLRAALSGVCQVLLSARAGH